MKKCPTCNRTFTDDALSFCLDDGSPLLSAGGGNEPQSYDPGATIQYNPGRETNPQPPTPPYTPAQFQGQQPQQPAWAPMPPVGGMHGQPPPPRKKSKALFWVFGAIAAVVVLVIGGAVLVFVLAGMSDSNTNNANNSNSNTNSNSNANNLNSSNSNANTSSTPSKTYVAQDDFSGSGWWVGTNAFGTGEYVSGQYHLTGAGEGGYLGTYGPSTFLSRDATTRMTVRNVNGLATKLGFGILLFGEIKDGQLDDYAFLIRTDEDPAYRITVHEGGKETLLADWTSASQIRSGTSSNLLEVRASSSTLDFYINGQFAHSVANATKNTSGAVGVFTSGLSTVAFDDLEIYK